MQLLTAFFENIFSKSVLMFVIGMLAGGVISVLSSTFREWSGHIVYWFHYFFIWLAGG